MPLDLKHVGGQAAQAAQAALMFLAAKKAGPQAVAAMMQGVAHAREQARLQQHQTAQDQRQQMLDQSTLQTQQMSRDNMQATNQLAQQKFQSEQQQGAMGSLDKYAQTFADPNNPVSDPTQAENAVMQRAATMASLQGKAPDTYTGLVPNMGPIVTGKKKKQAEDLYAKAEKLYGPEAMANDTITLKSEAFGDVKPSALRAMFAPQATDQAGQAAMPYVKPTPQPNGGSLEDYVLKKYGPSPTPEQILQGRKDYSGADNTPKAGDEPIQPDDVQGAAQAILSGRMAPSQLSLVGGMGNRGVKFKQAVVAEVNKNNPQFNWQQAEAGFKFASNVGTQTTVRMLDQIKKTLPVLKQASDDFKRSNVRMINSALLAGKQQFGATDVTKFEFARNILADEIAKILQGGGTGSGTSDAKLKQAQDLLSGDMTPDQLSSALSVAEELLGSRRETLTEGTFMAQPPTPTPASGGKKYQIISVK